MPKISKPLTDMQVRNAKPGPKPYKLADGGALYVEVATTGAKYWRWKYRHAGREKRLAFGVYPTVSLADARTARDRARRLLSDGKDPSRERQAEKWEAKQAGANTFETVTREWLELQRGKIAPTTYDKALKHFELYAFPRLGNRPIAAIDSHEMLEMLRRVEKRGIHETVHRVKQRCGQVFRYAIATRRAQHDPTAALRGALAPAVTRHYATITDPSRIGGLLRSIDGYAGQQITQAALRLAPLVFVRPGELRHAEWTEFDLEQAEWRIPAGRMKMGEEHVVPLPRQAVSIFAELQPITGRGRYVFPSIRSAARPMSENTVNAALRRLGYTTEEMTGHGFRAMASSRLNEMGFPPDVIERQLAHAERNRVRAAYNRASYLPERRRMMQHWADYLDALRDDENVVAGRFARPAA